MKVEDMKGGYTTGSCATAGMKAGLLALLDKNIVDQVVIENPQGQYIEVPIKAIEVISDTEAKVTVMKDGGDDPDVTHGNDRRNPTVPLMILVNCDFELALV